MGQVAMRTVLLVCCLLSASVVVNVMFLQDRQHRLAVSTPVTVDGTPRRSSPAAGGTSVPAVGRRQPAQALPDADLVRAIQRELYAGGYTRRPPDGVLDTATRAAILAWEMDNGVSLTGTPTNRLLKTLLLGASADQSGRPQAPSPEATDLIRHVQRLLKAHGHDLPQANGRLDDATKRAIFAFEKSQGLTPRGRISEAVVVRLERLGRRG